MIDTDRYEGHTPVREEWPRWCEDWLFNLYSGKTDDGSHTPNWNQDNNLACDAPLLLAEVKRLRGLLTQSYDELSLAIRWVERYFESKGHSTAYVAQTVENLERFIEEGDEE